MFQGGQHLIDQRIVVVGLFDEIEGAVLQGLDRHRDVAVAGQKNHGQSTIQRAQPVEQLDAAHAGHSHIKQQAPAKFA
jgi:hypothetical protein